MNRICSIGGPWLVSHNCIVNISICKQKVFLKSSDFKERLITDVPNWIIPSSKLSICKRKKSCFNLSFVCVSLQNLASCFLVTIPQFHQILVMDNRSMNLLLWMGCVHRVYLEESISHSVFGITSVVNCKNECLQHGLSQV